MISSMQIKSNELLGDDACVFFGGAVVVVRPILPGFVLQQNGWDETDKKMKNHWLQIAVVWHVPLLLGPNVPMGRWPSRRPLVAPRIRTTSHRRSPHPLP